MKIFLSHTTYDVDIANFLKGALGPRLGVEVFVLPGNAAPGSRWIDEIREGARSSDQLFSVMSPQSVRRPWMLAEWACFWMQGKTVVPLLVEIGPEELWDPMRESQSVALADHDSVVGLLQSISVATGIEPVGGAWVLANEIVEEVKRLRTLAARRDIESVVLRVRRDLRAGTDNVDGEDVRRLVGQGRLDDLLAMVTADDASAVKQRQVAVALIHEGLLDEAARIGEFVGNRAEIRTICVEVVRRIPRGANEESAEWVALDRLYSGLGGPQRRDVLEALAQRGITPLGRWS